MKTSVKNPPVKVLSRFVSQRNRYGERVKNTRWGKWQRWGKHKDNALNVKDAIQYAVFSLKVWNTGTVVYVLKGSGPPTRIYHAKLGNDGSRFLGWHSNPAADYWRRRVS
jgi:hypothetical protein